MAIHECSLRINHISINYLVANDNVNQVQKAIPLFTIFYFSVRNEEDLARVDEHLNTEKIFNVAVIFYVYYFQIHVTFFIVVLQYAL